MVAVRGAGASATVARAPATVLHVSSTGNDANSGRSWYEAKLTIRGAVEALPQEGGTIRYQSGVWAQPDHSLGLWFSGEPQHQAAGWMAPKAFHLFGMPDRNAGGSAGGPTALIQAPNDYPMKLFATSHQMVFENVELPEARTPLRIMIDDDGTRGLWRNPERVCVNTHFLNCWFRTTQVAGHGPTVDIGDLAFWIWFEYCTLSANEQELMASDLRANILSDGTILGSPLGVSVIRDCNFNGGGGIRMKSGGTGGFRLDLANIVQEGTTTGAVPGSAQPVLDLVVVGGATAGFVTVHNILQADSTYAEPTVRVDPRISPDVVTVSGCDSVEGPATILGSGSRSGQSPPQQQQVGFSRGRAVGQHDGARRAFGPVVVRFPTLAGQDVETWGSKPGSASVTTGLSAPDGTLGAARLSGTSFCERQVYRGTRPVALGDWLIAGVWARSPELPALMNAGALAVAMTGAGYTFSNGKTILPDDLPWQTTNWAWLSAGERVMAIGPGPTEVIMGLRADAGKAMEYYAPVLIHIPAGTVSDAEAAEILSHLASYPEGAAAGDVALLPGQKLYVGGRPTVTGSRGTDAALTSLLTHLATEGVVVDGTTAPQGSILYSSDFQPLAVTVPAPTAAPGLSVAQVYGGTYADASVYDVAYTYEGYTGETQISPIATFTCSNLQAIAALPIAALGTKAIGARFYIRKDGGSYRLADHAGITTAARQRCGFGDEGPYGGVILNYNAAGAVAPGSNTALDSDGATAIANPTVAPTLFDIGKLGQSTTYHVAYSYVAADGTETAVSPSASAMTASGSGQMIRVSRANTYLPSGACFVRLYAGLSAGALKYQKTIPLHFVTAELHTFDAAGVANSPGAAQTTITSLQRMIDAMLQVPGSVGYAVFDDLPSPHPTIIRATNAGGGQVSGFRLIGMSAHDMGATNTRTRVIYSGANDGECLVFAGNSWQVENIWWTDPDHKAKYGWAGCDYVGSGGFTSQWESCQFDAGRDDSRGLIVSCQSGVTMGNHTASEQWFRACTFAGSWGIDIHGNQTVNFRFRDAVPASRGTNGANGGEVRIAAGLVTFDGTNQNGHGQYVYYLTTDSPHAAGGDPDLLVDGGYLEMYGGRCIFYLSGVVTNTAFVGIRGSNFQNTTGAVVYGLCIIGPGVVTLDANPAINGDVLLVHPNSRVVEVGQTALSGSAAYKAANPTYSNRGPALRNAAYSLINESGQESQIRTNAAGQIVLSQASAPILPTSATLAETIAALQAAGLVRQS